MTGGSLSTRYARALLAIGIDSQQFERFGEQLARVAALMEQHKDLRTTIENPSYATARRRAIIEQLAGRLQLAKPVRNFLLLLLDRNRLSLLPDISRAYGDLADIKAGRVRAEVTSAHELTPAALAGLRAALEKSTGKEVLVNTRIDGDIIAGIVTRIGSTVWDGSLRQRLDQMRQTLLRGRT